MRSPIILILFLVNILWSGSSKVYGQDSDAERIRILFIFDGSNSMNAVWQKSSKIKVARALMLRTLDSLKDLENVELALRLYGHQTKIVPGHQDCNDTKLEVPFSSNKSNVQRIKDQLRALQPKGTTPIALSLELAANDFPECDNCRNVIILITDGIEACDGDPCAVAKALNSKGIKLKPFIIGVGLDTSYLGQFNCIGEFLSADTEDSFEGVLSYVVSQAINNTTVQVNINNIQSKPKETDVTMSFYNQKNRKLEYTYMHTMNLKRDPDTMAINPLFTYKLVVHTVPEIIVENIKVIPGKHNTIMVDGPQGFLDLRIQGNGALHQEIGCIVRKAGTMQTLNFQPMNTTHKYLVGKYDLELLTLPRTYIDNIEIKQSRNSKIVIPNSGLVTIRKRNGPCQIFELKDGKENWVCNVQDNYMPTTIKLLPGNYKVTFRMENIYSTANTIQKRVTITPGHEDFLEF